MGRQRSHSREVGPGSRLQKLRGPDRYNGCAPVRATAEQAVKAGVEAILLGCAGMANWGVALHRHLSAPVIDGAAAAVKHAEGLVAQGRATAMTGAYRFPSRKVLVGQFANDVWLDVRRNPHEL